MALVPGAQAPLLRAVLFSPHLTCQHVLWTLQRVLLRDCDSLPGPPCPPNSICNAAARGAASKCKSDRMISLLKISASCHVSNKIQTPHSDRNAPRDTACHLILLLLPPHLSLSSYSGLLVPLPEKLPPGLTALFFPSVLG